MSKVAKATMGLMVVTIIAKILGFGRELVLASSYGASMYSDAYITAINIPVVIFTIIGTTLSTVLIPMYFEIRENEGDIASLKFINNMFNIVIVICTLLSIIGFIFAEELVKVFAIGFKDETLIVTIKYTKIIIIGIIFTGLSYVMSAYLQIKNNFTVPGLVTVPRNMAIIISIIMSVNTSPDIMIWGALIGSLLEFLFQIPFAYKNGYKYKLYFNLRESYIKRILVLITPVLIGVAVNQINVMVDKTLASTLVEGSISALNYANKLNGFVIGIFITSVAAVIYPMLSKLLSKNNNEEFVKYVSSSINSVIILIIPISIGAVVLADPIVRLLFQRGEFNLAAVKMTSIALVMYSIGMTAVGLRDILNRVFYSLKDTKTPMVNGAMSMGMNIILNFILVKYFKIAGLALATSISSIICIVLLLVSLEKKIGYFGQDKIFKTTIKSIISAIIMGFGTYTSYNYLNIYLGNEFIFEFMKLMISIIIGIIIYGVMIVSLKVEEVNSIISIVKNKIGKNVTIEI